MAEQGTQFNPEQLTPEEVQMIREQRARQEQEQASEFANVMQMQAENRVSKRESNPQIDPEQIDIPGITREHVPLDSENTHAFTNVEQLNAILNKKVESKIDLNPSETIDQLASVMDLEK